MGSTDLGRSVKDVGMKVQRLASDILDVQELLQQQRPLLVRVCTRLTGDADTAEDLAQETLIEAWRHLHQLRDPAARYAWLSGIARNVCRRWMRQQRTERTRIDRIGHTERFLADREGANLSGVDLDVELERHELVALLDRALQLLPPAARDLLVRKYVDQASLAEIAARLGVSEGTVGVRLHRGKRLLQKVLTQDLREEALAYGLVNDDVRQETRLWCPYCGTQRLVGHFSKRHDGVRFQLHCADWCYGPGIYVSNSDGPLFLDLLTPIKGYKPAFSRVMRWVDAYYRCDGAINRRVACLCCGRPAVVRLALPAHIAPLGPEHRGVHVWCPACCLCPAPHEYLTGLLLCTPAGRAFWRTHERIRALPERAVEVDGQAALVKRFESVAGTGWLDLLVARDTYQLLAVHGTGPAEMADDPTGVA